MVGVSLVLHTFDIGKIEFVDLLPYVGVYPVRLFFVIGDLDFVGLLPAGMVDDSLVQSTFDGKLVDLLLVARVGVFQVR